MNSRIRIDKRKGRNRKEAGDVGRGNKRKGKKEMGEGGRCWLKPRKSRLMGILKRGTLYKVLEVVKFFFFKESWWWGEEGRKVRGGGVDRKEGEERRGRWGWETKGTQRELLGLKWASVRGEGRGSKGREGGRNGREGGRKGAKSKRDCNSKQRKTVREINLSYVSPYIEKRSERKWFE